MKQIIQRKCVICKNPFFKYRENEMGKTILKRKVRDFEVRPRFSVTCSKECGLILTRVTHYMAEKKRKERRKKEDDV